MKRAVAALVVVALASCAGSGAMNGVPAGSGPLIGVYRAAIDDGSGVARHVRVLLWAAPPDRLHAELLAPVGGVRFVLDAGAGAACVVDVAGRVAYAGDAGPAAIEGLVGVPVSIEDAVAALLTGSPPSGIRVERAGGGPGELPERFLIADGARSLDLTRVRFERGSAAADTLGTGRPPAGMSARPMRDLRAAAAEGGGG